MNDYLFKTGYLLCLTERYLSNLLRVPAGVGFFVYYTYLFAAISTDQYFSMINGIFHVVDL